MIVVVVVMSIIISALVGLPFLAWRWHRKIPMTAPAMPSGMPWPMLGGMLCAQAAVVLPWMALFMRHSLADVIIVGLFAISFLGTVVSAFAGTLFLATSAMAGGAADTSRKRQFLVGAALAAGMLIPMALGPLLMPESWQQQHHKLLLALELNLGFWIPGLAGYAYGRHFGRNAPQRRIDSVAQGAP